MVKTPRKMFGSSLGEDGLNQSSGMKPFQELQKGGFFLRWPSRLHDPLKQILRSENSPSFLATSFPYPYFCTFLLNPAQDAMLQNPYLPSPIRRSSHSSSGPSSVPSKRPPSSASGSRGCLSWSGGRSSADPGVRRNRCSGSGASCRKGSGHGSGQG